MEYDDRSFRDMVNEKIAKKDSERGAIEGVGFPLHGGKPIKELYRTVYTGGPGCPGGEYMKNPVTDPKVVQTNEEGVSQKAVKSWKEVDSKEEEDLKNATRSPQPPNMYHYSKPDLAHSGYDEDEVTEHEEKSFRDMVTEKNTTRFVKYTEPESVDEDVPIGENPESEPVTWNAAPENGKYPPEVYQRFIDTNKKYGVSIPQDQMDGWLDDIWDMSQYTASGSTTGAAKDPDAAAGANLLFNAAYRR